MTSSVPLAALEEFCGSDAGDDLVLLRPDLLNGYTGAIIRAARAHVDEIGCVLEADIDPAHCDCTGVERLQPAYAQRRGVGAAQPAGEKAVGGLSASLLRR